MKRQHSESILAFRRTLGCILCGDDTSVEPAHVRYGDPRAGKRQTGLGEKSDDRWTLPLCSQHHRDQHARGERQFWASYGVDPVKACMALTENHGDREAAERILAAHR